MVQKETYVLAVEVTHIGFIVCTIWFPDDSCFVFCGFRHHLHAHLTVMFNHYIKTRQNREATGTSFS